MKKIYRCKTCGKIIHKHTVLYGNGECKSCCQKGNKSYLYKDGRASKENHCLDCDILLSDYRIKRCKDCKGEHYSKTFSGENSPTYKGGMPRCPICNRRLSAKKAKYCSNCIGSTKRGLNNSNAKANKNTLHRHHVDLNHKNTKKSNIIILTASKHMKIHAKAYNYLVETGQITTYIKWFDKNFGLK